MKRRTKNRDPRFPTWSALATTLVVAACSAGAPHIGPTITVAESGASNPTLAVDATGAAWVAWVENGGEASNVWLAHSADGERFDPPVRVNDRDGDAAPHEQAPAQIEVGPEGNIYVLWQNNTVVEGRMYPYSNLRLARSVDGGRSFDPAISVNDDAAGPPSSHTFHDVAVAPDGTVYVSWIDSRVRTEAERNAPAAAATDHVGHGDPSLPGPEIRVARSMDGGRTFGPGVVVATDACPCCRTALAVSGDGTVYLSWRTVIPGSIRDIVVARSDDRGATFTAASRVSADDWVFDACPHAGSSVALDTDGGVHVAWYTGAEGGPGIYTAVSGDGGRTFTDVKALLAGEWVPPSQVKIAGVAGGLAMAWDDRRSGTPELTIAFSDAATGQVVRADWTARGASPAIASAGGFAAVAWLDGDAVRYARLISGENGSVSK